MYRLEKLYEKSRTPAAAAKAASKKIKKVAATRPKDETKPQHVGYLDEITTAAFADITTPMTEIAAAIHKFFQKDTAKGLMNLIQQRPDENKRFCQAANLNADLFEAIMAYEPVKDDNNPHQLHNEKDIAKEWLFGWMKKGTTNNATTNNGTANNDTTNNGTTQNDATKVRSKSQTPRTTRSRSKKRSTKSKNPGSSRRR